MTLYFIQCPNDTKKKILRSGKHSYGYTCAVTQKQYLKWL